MRLLFSILLAPAIMILTGLFCTASNTRANSLPVVKIKAEEGDWMLFKQSHPAEAEPLSVRLLGVSGRMVYHGNPRNLRRRFASKRRQSFRISFTEPVKKLNARTVIYRTKAADKTFLREVIAYKMFASAGIESPRARLILLQVNNKPIGLFVEVVPVDALSVEKMFDGNAADALLYYGDPKRRKKRHAKSDFLPLNNRDEYPLSYTSVVNNSDNNYAALERLFQVLNERPFDARVVNSVIDFDEWARWFAVSEILENADSPWHKGARNYSLLKPPSGKWMILPWDLDRVYKGKGYYMPETKINGLRGLLSDAGFIALKMKYVRQYLIKDFNSKKIFSWIDEISPAIEQAISRGMESSVDLDVWREEARNLKRIIRSREKRLLELSKRFEPVAIPAQK